MKHLNSILPLVLLNPVAETAGNVVAAENAPTPTIVEVKPTEPVTFELNEFEEGDFKGFKYTTPVHNITGRSTTLTVDEATKAAIETYGESTVLALLDGQILGRIRTKVKNGLPKGLKPHELSVEQQKLLTLHPDGVLFDATAASAWRPDVRELSPNQLFKKAKEAFNDANKETDLTKKMALMQKGQQYLLEMSKALGAA